MKASTLNALRIGFRILALLSAFGLVVIYNYYPRFTIEYTIGAMILVALFSVFSILNMVKSYKKSIKIQMTIQEEMNEFIQEIAEEFNIDEDDVRKYCFKNYDVETDSNTNKNSIRWKIKNGEFAL